MNTKEFALAMVLTTCLSVNTSFAQTHKIDSLKHLVETAHDTTKVNALRWLSIYSRSASKQKTMEYGLLSLKKSEDIGYKKGEVKALNVLAINHGIAGDYVASLSYLKKALTKATAYKEYQTLLSVYNNFGIVYKRIGDYPTSKDYYLKTLKLVDSLDLNHDVSFVYTNLGVLYDLMNDEEKAIESYEKSLEVYRGDNRKALEIKTISNIAMLDIKNGKFENALKKLLEVVAFYEKEKDDASLALQYNSLAVCYIKLKEWRLANSYLQKALELSEKLSLKEEILASYYNLSELRFNEKKYSEAIVYNNKNLELAKLYDAGFSKKYEAHQQASEIHQAIGDFPKSIHHLKQSMNYKDSLLDESKIREIENLQIKYDVSSMEREIKENELQLALLVTNIDQKQKSIVYVSIIAILLMFSASLLYFRYRNKQKSIALLTDKNVLISNQKEVIEEMNVELEKRMLRAQMNPHFIFNSLSSIQYLVNSGDKKGALAYLSKFSKLLRQVLETSINVSLVLREEIELIKIYIELEALRFSDSFSYSIDIDENLDLDNYEIPMLLIQPYVENAIIHGLIPKKGAKHLTVAFSDKGKNIECVIEDNGIGFQKLKPENKNKISRGMSITEKRINALKNVSDQELVKIEKLNEKGTTGTKVTILIPKD